jgi:hypothetical protein
MKFTTTLAVASLFSAVFVAAIPLRYEDEFEVAVRDFDDYEVDARDFEDYEADAREFDVSIALPLSYSGVDDS